MTPGTPGTAYVRLSPTSRSNLENSFPLTVVLARFELSNAMPMNCSPDKTSVEVSERTIFGTYPLV